MTNKGLRLDQSNLTQSKDITTILYITHCNRYGWYDKDLGIHLMKTPHGYVRFLPHILVESYTLHNSPKMSSVVGTPVFIAKTIHSEDSAAIAKSSIGFTVESEEVHKLFVWPRTFYNSTDNRAYFYTEDAGKTVLIECFGPSDQQDKFFMKIRLDLWSLSIYPGHWDDFECAKSGLKDLETLVKTNKHQECDVNELFDRVGHRSCQHVFEHLVDNNQEELFTSGALFTCAVKIIQRPKTKRIGDDALNPRVLEIKITRKTKNKLEHEPTPRRLGR
ncbi:hypothetical protein F4782DRAFT_390251 [Xylaria castorea]|nr:hypothetical protein F4782DRAFT_390251 [Xylaria castorea]